MGSLDNYVRITHHDKKLEPLLSDAQQLLSQENLRVMLEQAQIALLREEAVVYQQSVEKSVEWLHKYYSHYPEKIAMVALLNELKVQPILSELPSVAASLYTLSQYIDSHSQATNKTTTAVSEKKRILPNKNDTTDEIKSIKPKAVKNVSEPSVEAVK
jgi:uroporphyrin-3 C-methyltransferase